MAEADIVPKFYIGDTETCGLPPHHYPCQIGLQQIDPNTFDVLWEIESLIDPEYPIGEYASGMHGITNEMVADEPTLAEFVELKLNGGLTGEITMIAHKIDFDIKALSQCGPISRTVCSLFEARQLRHLFKDLEDCKLQTLRAYFGIKTNDAHQALADCDTTRQVLQKLVQVSGRTLEQLASTPDRVVHTMPYGKFKGLLIVQIPKDYLRWMMDNTEMEKNLKASVEKAYALK